MKMALRIAFVTLAVATLASGASAPARAQALGGEPQRWQFELTPYLWGAGLSGDIRIGDLSASGIQASPSDLLKNLDIGAMGAFEGRKGLWGFVTDGMYLHLSHSEPTPQQGFGDAHLDLTQQLYSVAGTYRAAQGETPVDLVAGARYNYLKNDLELTPGALAGRKASLTEDWWDGFVGAHAQHRFGEKWFVSGYADIGAGGSKFTWQAVAGGGYDFNKTFSGKVGYRVLGVDRETDEFLYDMTTAGFVVGLGIRW